MEIKRHAFERVSSDTHSYERRARAIRRSCVMLERHRICISLPILSFSNSFNLCHNLCLTFQTVSPVLYCKSFPASDLWLLKESDEKNWVQPCNLFFYLRTYWMSVKDGLGSCISRCQWQTSLGSTFFVRDSSFVWEGCDVAKSQFSAGNKWIDSHQIMAEACF